jgi:hypothetical protein
MKGPVDGPILVRAIYTLNVARRHWLLGWDDRAGRAQAIPRRSAFAAAEIRRHQGGNYRPETF